jgi:hypothetical protein
MAIGERRSTLKSRGKYQNCNVPIHVGITNLTNRRLASIPPFVSIIRMIADELELLALVYSLQGCYHICEQWL